ncbi:MAG: hypothetical protein VCD50_02265 [Alphaproteobacteria bacterium]
MIVQDSLAGLETLLAHTDAMVRAAFAPHDPLRAHQALDPERYRDIAETLIAAFQRGGEVRTLFRDMFIEAGVDPSRVYWDKLRLRIQPPGETHMSRHLRNLPAHRDTWGSNLLAQINWWAPLYPLTTARTLVLYPAHWQAAIANTSAAWDYEALRQAHRTGASYPLLPVASGMIDRTDQWPVVIEPGALMCFSGAHLHASIPNTTDVARFNIETRTVSLDDLAAKRGAPDIDGGAPRRPLEWFTRMADGAPLSLDKC